MSARKKPVSAIEAIERQLSDLLVAVRAAIAHSALEIEEADTMTLGELIRTERAHRRMSLQDVAAASGMTNSHIWQLENGRARNPTVKAMRGISRAFGISFVVVCNSALRSAS